MTRLLSGLVQLLLQRLQHRVAFVSTRNVSSHAGATRRAEVVPMSLECAFLGLDQHPLPTMSIEKLNQSARLLARRPRVGYQRRNDGSSDWQQGPACSGGVAAASTSADGSRRCKHGPAERVTNWTDTDDVALVFASKKRFLHLPRTHAALAAQAGSGRTGSALRRHAPCPRRPAYFCSRGRCRGQCRRPARAWCSRAVVAGCATRCGAALLRAACVSVRWRCAHERCFPPPLFASFSHLVAQASAGAAAGAPVTVWV